MRLRVCFPPAGPGPGRQLLDSVEAFVEAFLSTEHPASSDGKPVLVLGDGLAVGVEDALMASLRIYAATPAERAALLEAGYVLPDEGLTTRSWPPFPSS